jgi:hypothetical protein
MKAIKWFAPKLNALYDTLCPCGCGSRIRAGQAKELFVILVGAKPGSVFWIKKHAELAEEVEPDTVRACLK